MTKLLPTTIVGKVIAALVLVDLVVIGTGVYSLMTLSDLHQRVQAVTSRDLTPISHLRKAQNAEHSMVITGFAAGQSDDAAVSEQLLSLMPKYQQTVDTELAALVETIPTELRGQAEEQLATYEAFIAADAAYKAGATGPDAAALADEAQGLFEATEAGFDALADTLVADAEEQEAAVTAAYQSSLVVTFALVGLSLAIGLGVAIALATWLRRRTAAVLHTLDGLAEGDLTRRAGLTGTDEIGRMAISLDRGLDSVHAAISRAARSAQDLTSTASGLTDSAQETNAAVSSSTDAVTGVANASATISNTMSVLAASTQELGASIREISSSAQQAAQVAGDAVTTVESTNGTITQLGASSQEISDVVKLITSIAEQTNLLALNATIEAARAGEAGKGFAVVANEVKELAQETARATEDIARRVEAIQGDAAGAVQAVGEIGTVIETINSLQATIAAAVEEQSATTDVISGNVGEAVGMTQQITDSLVAVDGSAQATLGTVEVTRDLAGKVSEQGAELTSAVGHFRL